MDVDQKEIDARFHRLRAKNRAAQIRYRQRAQEELETLKGRLRDVQTAIDAARECHAELQRQQVRRSTRAADAAAALAATRAPQPLHPTAAAYPPARALLHPPRSGTCAAASAHPVATASTDPTQSVPSSHASGTCAETRCHAGADLPRILIKPWRCPSVLQAPLHQPPRRIAAYRTSASISYDDLRAAAAPASRLVDFSQHALADLSDRVCAHKAAQLQLPCGEVCWFVQTVYEVAEGTPLSLSASLSSPECLASFVLQYLISRLELTLVVAVASQEDCDPQQSGASDKECSSRQHGDTSEAAEQAPPTKTPRPQPPPPAAAVRAGASPLVDAGSSGRSAASVPSDAPPAGAAHSAAYGAPEAGVPAWSSCVRVGVGQLFDAREAVRSMLHRLLRAFCPLLPLPVLYQILATYHEVLARMTCGFNTAEREAASAEVRRSANARSTGDDHMSMACVMVGRRGVVEVFVDALEAATDMHVLRCLEAEGPSALLWGGECCPQRDLEEYTHISVAACALLLRMTLLWAPRAVMNMSFYGKHLQLRLDGEIDTFHVRLYRQMQLTEADRSRLVAHLRAWKQVNVSLDAPFHAALATLERLPQASDIPAALVSHISAADAGTHVRGSARGSCAVSCACMHDPHACSSGEYDVAREATHAQCGVLCMLGACAKETASAERGLLALRDVQEAHGRVRRETKELQMQPGVLLRPLQIARLLTTHIFCRAAQADMMKLCQLATSQQRWRDLASLFRGRFVHPPPPQLPSYQWLEGAAW